MEAKISSSKEEYQEKRNALFALSTQLKPLADAQGVRVNELIIAHYAAEIGCSTIDFHTFYSWKERGFKVKKGERGFAVWARPKDVIKGEKTGQPAEDENKFFGLAYMFHKGQVETLPQAAGTGAN